MAEGIHQISLEIGKLMQHVQTLERGQREIARKQDESVEKLEKIAGMESDITDLKTGMTSLTTLKNKGAGLLLGVSIISGALGTFLDFIWDYWKGQ